MVPAESSQLEQFAISRDKLNRESIPLLINVMCYILPDGRYPDKIYFDFFVKYTNYESYLISLIVIL
jgi:hypothetical protein